MVPAKLLVVMSLSHDSSHPLLFEVVKVNMTSLLGFSLIVELNVWSYEGDVSG
jgi:hypothetical protein